MNVLKNEFILFVKCKALFIVMIGYVIVTTLYLIYSYQKYGIGLTYLTPLQYTLKLSIGVFILFAVISYEFFYKTKKVQLEEVLKITPMGRNKLYVNKFVVLSSFALIITILNIIYCSIVFFSTCSTSNEWSRTPILLHIMKCIIIYVFLVSIIGILIGIVISFIDNRLIGLAIIFLIVFLVSPLFESIAITMWTTSEINIYPIVGLFDILPINLHFTPNYSTGIIILPYKISLIFFWISFLLFLIFINLTRKLKINIPICILVCSVFLAYYFIPSSKITMNRDPNSSAGYDQNYYSHTTNREEPADYKILTYDMDIHIGENLNATVEMMFDIKKEEYNMTLYHKYKVLSVTDQNDNALQYKRYGDYLVISSNPDTEIISVEYKGSSPRYYSNSQGIYLPGYFAYYPKAGFLNMIDEENGDLYTEFCGYKSKYNIEINYKNSVFCNIDESKKNTFYGECNGVTLFSGFLTETSKDSVRVIYPYLFTEFNSKSINNMIDELNRDGLNNTTIFLAPRMNETINNGVSDDHIVHNRGFFSTLEELE